MFMIYVIASLSENYGISVFLTVRVETFVIKTV
jgi:hypothetical protein